MKIFLKTLLFFSLFAMVAYICLIILWGEVMPYSVKKNLIYPLGENGHMFSRVQEIPKFENIDILFLGSSHAYRGFDPRIFNKALIRSFNLGSSFQTPIQTEILLSRYLDHLNPKLVIFEVYPEIFTNDGVESSLDLIANDRIDGHAVRMAFHLNNVKTYNTLIFGIYNNIFNTNSDFAEKKITEDDIYVSAGYVQRISNTTPVGDAARPREWVFREDQKLAFERIIQTFTERSIAYVLIQAPITSSLYQSYRNNDEVEEYFRSKGRYYNFNDIIQLSESAHFYDKHHLNQRGVEMFNHELIRLLRENNDLAILN